eukprot:TRINITY_DN502_c0_g1_i2.p1 TRINITY_DN502_c0_g1~~TRINITY_DN502_c0_g1_i2.p1  ORF type:complete len:563 (+),score=115.39 TRINITY_DN502_c0_g1_i2:109-1689(+)
MEDLDGDQLINALGSSPDGGVDGILFPELSELRDDSPSISIGEEPSTNSNHSSPYSDSPQQQHIEFSLEATLFHKPRGSQGIWQPVGMGEGLRVTKGKGKRLKVQVRSSVPLDKSRIDIFGLDLVASHPAPNKDGFTIEGAFDVNDPNVAEFEIKLVKYCKRLQFVASVATPMGPKMAKTIIFQSHNNGKANKNEISDQPITTAEKKRKTVEGVDSPEPPITSQGGVTVIDGPLEVNGAVKARAFLQFSDLRLKTNIVELVDALDIVSKLEGKSYEWKEGVFADGAQVPAGGRVIGLIAQEVQKVLPEVVHTDAETGILSVSYAEIVPVLIEAMKEHLLNYKEDQKGVIAQITELRSKMSDLEKRNRTFNSKTSQLILVHHNSPGYRYSHVEDQPPPYNAPRYSEPPPAPVQIEPVSSPSPPPSFSHPIFPPPYMAEKGLMASPYRSTRKLKMAQLIIGVSTTFLGIIFAVISYFVVRKSDTVVSPYWWVPVTAGGMLFVLGFILSCLSWRHKSSPYDIEMTSLKK